MDKGEEDRLSALPDDILRRILHRVNSKEAASTSVLSRRWASLWRSSGAVDLAARIPYEILSSHHQEAFSHAAAAALAAAEVPVTRLALSVDTDGGNDTVLRRFIHGGRNEMYSTSTDEGVFRDVLSHPAARHVEDLRVALVDTFDAVRFSGMEIYGSIGICCFASLPSRETLRVLDLTRCDLAPAAFPRLATLHLRLCSMQLTDLHALLDAAPVLTDVHLESVLFTYTIQQHVEVEPPELAMRLPSVTTLVLALCGVLGQGTPHGQFDTSCAIAIDAPRLRSFVYKGLLHPFQLRSASPELARADLHFLKDDSASYSKERTRMLFWQSVQSFSGAKALTLKVDHELKEIAAIGKERRAQLLCPLPNVERLELEGWHRPTSTTAAVAIANLLHCCHALRDLTLKLSTVPPDSEKGSNYAWESLRKDLLDYSRSIDRFRRRSSRISMEDSNNGVRYHDVQDISGMSGESFACLQRSLRRVSMEFRLDHSSSTCIGLRLVKFFAENAMALEEMRIDSGNWRLYEHLNLSGERWIARENPAAEVQCEFSTVPSVPFDSTTDLGRSTIGFTVLPLQRRKRMRCMS
ncbi:hypothetical protein HU200_012784 [Digitaria exilis]|uniref:F-box domain-containing protein n=1 Tax=Digitaria exilis TaxID=1010633 RepID=A0A835KLJ6_9POAL|nr:hypothetical protein HU200_012784 [Digitaria exilis]CAB3461720.1 unnamed protein product [Digitaria exilis]